MKSRKILSSVFASLTILLVIAAVAVLSFAQGTPFNAGKGAFRGDVYVPSAFNFWFGDNTSSDIRLTKVAANTLGVGPAGSHIGATAANKDVAGACTLGTNCAVTFVNAYTSNPVCVGTDTTAIDAVKSAVSTTGVTFTGTGTDVIDYICMGNPN